MLPDVRTLRNDSEASIVGDCSGGREPGGWCRGTDRCRDREDVAAAQEVLMKKLTTGSFVAALVIAAPAGAIAAAMHVDNAAGPTVVHDHAYDAIHTTVHSASRDGSTTVRL